MANEINPNLQTVRTIEDIVNFLSIIFTNLNNQNEMYYDMFLNPEPMDLDLERYDENGVLTTVTLPNVAKMRVSSYSGPGDPNGKQVASIGALYIDTLTRDLYYKAMGNDSFGWQMIWSTSNLTEGGNILPPDGDGSQLQNLNANNITMGTLAVSRGGTGVNTITGLIKGNGTYPFTEAVAGVDYMAPLSFTGLIMYSPVAEVPDGFLVCDGTVYNINTRPELANLCRKLGNKYGGNGTTTFGVPNLIDKYIKGGTVANVGTVGNANVGTFTAQISGSTANDGAHTHNRGNMNITGWVAPGNGASKESGTYSYGGAFYIVPGGSRGDQHAVGGEAAMWVFDAARAWTGETSATPHSHAVNMTVTGGSGKNDVDHIEMVPIIKY